MEYKTILCPIDDSDLAEKVIDAAAYLGKVTDAKVILLYVVEKWYRSEPLVTDSEEWEKIHEEWLKEGRDVLKENAVKLQQKGLKHVETVLEDGEAAYEIVALASQKRVDVIVMATHRYSPMGKLFMGSVTDKVTRKAPCPVLWLFA